MLSRFLKTYLIATSLAPVCLSLAYVSFERGSFWPVGVLFISIALLLGASSLKIIRLAQTRLESMRISVKKVRSADKEVIGFFVAYVLPLLFTKTVHLSVGAIFLFVFLLGFVIWGTHALQVNPLLGAFGFHFYETETDDGVTFILITKRKIINVKTINKVVLLTEYMVLEVL